MAWFLPRSAIPNEAAGAGNFVSWLGFARPPATSSRVAPQVVGGRPAPAMTQKACGHYVTPMAPDAASASISGVV
jgi:hypothetical protein